jgi:hypothetical protein
MPVMSFSLWPDGFCEPKMLTLMPFFSASSAI